MASKNPPRSGKRNATVLVTDSREPTQSSRRRSTPTETQPGPASRFVTVDNVLQYASDVPSMQQRIPPSGGFKGRSRKVGSTTTTGRSAPARSGAGASNPASLGGKNPSGLDPKLRATGRLASLPHLPPRSTKVTEKLVLLPETVIEEREDEDEEDQQEEEEGGEEEEETGERKRRRIALVGAEGLIGHPHGLTADESERFERLAAQQQLRRRDFAVDNESAPLLADEETQRRRRITPEKAKSYAERLPKARRAEKLPRVTAYCTAQAYKMNATAAFVREYHGARTKLYDDCLYTAYHLPLLPGVGGFRVRSSPVVKSAEGKAFLDEEIERNEQRDYHEEYSAHEEEHSVGVRSPEHNGENASDHDHPVPDEDPPSPRQISFDGIRNGKGQYHRKGVASTITKDTDGKEPTSPGTIPPNAFDFAEMFVFSYGVVVFWNFSERQEKDILADLAFSSSKAGTLPIATNPLPEEDFETEEFHFEYSTEISRPRVYNDMITLRSGDHMIKLAVSHGIAQSTKLSMFEEAMARQMTEAKDIPRRLALTGHLGMKREEVFRILGRLFKSRVDVNLSSNMLDVPNFFWDSEPMLHPLYTAVREYLEIKPRIQVLNERCRVFLDLAEILSDSIADNKMSRQTWIIIVLIFISIIVTLAEVILRFGILSTRSSSSSSVPAPATMISGLANVPAGKML